MIRQIKSLCLLFVLFAHPWALSAQDSVSVAEQQYIDSIRVVLTNDYARQLERYRLLSQQEAAANRSTIDSLQQLIREMSRELRDLDTRGYALRSEIEGLQLALQRHEALFEAEKQRFTRLLLVTGPSILALILLATVLFFLLNRRQQDATDRKINALKKYTHTEIEETRSDLMKKFRKRYKKLKEGLNARGGGKKEKKRGSKKEKSSKKE